MSHRLPEVAGMLTRRHVRRREALVLAFLEEPEAGHAVTDRMWAEGTRWLVRHLVEKPGRSSR